MAPILQIAIDGNEANVLQRVGSNAYAFEILRHLEQILENRTDIQVTVLLATHPVADLPSARPGWQYQVFGPVAFWTQFALPLQLFKERKKYQVFYTPGHYAPRISPIPYVSSVMDLAFLYFPEQFRKKDYLQLREWTRYSVEHARKVIAISQHTKEDVIKNYHLKSNQVIVAYPSVVSDKPALYEEKDKLALLKKWKIQSPFLLYVGTLQPRKNLLRLIEAFEKLHQEANGGTQFKNSRTVSQLKVQELQLVIAGKTGWLAGSILNKIKNSPLKDKIIVTGYISDQEKIILYKEALCTVLVGLYEGFGIPALEALQYGSIPVVSSTTSLPEVVGDAAIFVTPTSVADIARGLQQVVLLSAKERGTLLKKGRQQLKVFSWQKSAQIVLETLMQVAQSAVEK